MWEVLYYAYSIDGGKPPGGDGDGHGLVDLGELWTGHGQKGCSLTLFKGWGNK